MGKAFIDGELIEMQQSTAESLQQEQDRVESLRATLQKRDTKLVALQADASGMAAMLQEMEHLRANVQDQEERQLAVEAERETALVQLEVARESQQEVATELQQAQEMIARLEADSRLVDSLRQTHANLQDTLHDATDRGRQLGAENESLIQDLASTQARSQELGQAVERHLETTTPTQPTFPRASASKST